MANALAIVKRDHRAIKTEYKKFEAANESERKRIAERIFKALEAHALMEEELFYPIVSTEGSTEARNMIESSLAEHAETKQLIQRFRREQDWLGFGMKINELLAGVMHHVDEEEHTFLPLVRDSLSKTRLEELGLAMENASPTHGQSFSHQIGDRIKSDAKLFTKKVTP